jgi:hypothetical protein
MRRALGCGPGSLHPAAFRERRLIANERSRSRGQRPAPHGGRQPRFGGWQERKAGLVARPSRVLAAAEASPPAGTLAAFVPQQASLKVVCVAVLASIGVAVWLGAEAASRSMTITLVSLACLGCLSECLRRTSC